MNTGVMNSAIQEETVWLQTLPSMLQRAHKAGNAATEPKSQYIVQLRSGLRVTFGWADSIPISVDDDYIVASEWIYLGDVRSVEDAAGNSRYDDGAFIDGMDVRLSEIVFVLEPAVTEDEARKRGYIK